MGFQVGKFICEMSFDATGKVVTTWRPKTPLYLNRADRRQYRAGRDAFLRAAGKLPAWLGPQPATSWRALRRIAPSLAVAATLAGCARGGGIGLEAMVADNLCEQRGFHLGTPEYANCRNEIAYQRGIVNAQMQAYYQRQYERTMEEMNRSQTCVYNGSTIGGITGGTMTCR
jgi:hypothetical protein